MDKYIKGFTNIIISTRTTGLMLLIYAFSMAMATFVENDYGTPVAKALIYNSWWFELVMLILILNFVGNISRYKLVSFKKLPLLVFHLAFIIIFIGGAITRYVSFEGSMHIREGESSKDIVSDATFFKVQIGKGEQALAYDDQPFIIISNRIPSYLKMFKKTFTGEYDFYGERVKLKVVDFYSRAQDSLIVDPSGKPTLHLVVTENGQRLNKYIPSGTVQLIQNILISFNKPTSGAINIDNSKGIYQIASPFQGKYMIMATQERKDVPDNESPQIFHQRSLYTFGTLAFVVPEPAVSGRIMYYEGDKKTHEHDLDLVKVAISTATAKDTVSFYGGKGMTNFQYQGEVGGLRISMAYGSKIYPAPFTLKLTDFKVDRYPGSTSPAAYSSDIMIEDGAKQTPFKIFMNHVLDHNGYRFFQASFDEDELGTVLSVNHDWWGTHITYLGYTLLFSGLFVTLFWKGTHFTKMNEQLRALSKSKTLLLLFFFLPLSSAFSQEIDMHGKNGTQTEMPPHDHEHDHAQDNAPEHNHDEATDQAALANLKQILAAQTIDGATLASSISIADQHADQFGRLLVQNIDGRIEPVNTMALEVLRKLYRKDTFHSLNANQFFLAISTEPFNWVNVPLIKVGIKSGPELMQKVKGDAEGYTTMANLLQISVKGTPEFLLKDDYLKAFSKKPSDQDSYDKDVIELNDKLYVMQQLLDGSYLRVLPVAGDANNTWIAMPPGTSAASLTLNNPVAFYFESVLKAEKGGNWTAADASLNHIKALQVKHGKAVIPSQAKINWEVSYNSWNLFLNLMITYSILGTIILALAFVKLFKNSKSLNRLVNFVLVLIGIAVAMQALGLGIRWYISGHEPWSNGYEAVLFISWIGVSSGLLMYRNSNAFIPAAGCLIAVILMGFAHGGSQMNPQITPLVPVLKSYWLMIHVAIITSSYGFFGLSALLGTVVLILYIIDNDKISKKLKASVTELTLVNEMSLTVGIFLLTVGTFLGGIWANESWGRYWSWDPKETWAFISVIIYAFILHVRLIPGLKSKYLFNLLSLLGFSTIIMTYFGVNYYLTGLHSYATGDPVPIPSWVYVTITLVFILAVVSYLRFKKNQKKAPSSLR
jgi:cytochrome c-type biogenesis protein CcsB